MAKFHNWFATLHSKRSSNLYKISLKNWINSKSIYMNVLISLQPLTVDNICIMFRLEGYFFIQFICILTILLGLLTFQVLHVKNIYKFWLWIDSWLHVYVNWKFEWAWCNKTIVMKGNCIF